MIGFRTVLLFCLSVTLGLAPTASALDTPFIRGDADQDGEIGIGDPIRSLHHMFLGNPSDLGCNDAADANDNGELEIGDPVYSLVYTFLGGDSPPAPFPSCGEDPTADPLTCRDHALCPDVIDTEKPQFDFDSCTEIACQSNEIPMTIGEPMDLVSQDSCNSCAPIQVRDEGGIHRITVRLVSLSLDPGSKSFSVTWDLNPPVTSFVFEQELAEDLIIPGDMQPGPHLRRFVAIDRFGNEAFADFPVTLEKGPSAEVIQTQERDTSPDATESELAELVRGNTAFALDLYRTAVEDPKNAGSNVFFSPYSITMALAMTFAGARGETESQMAGTLHFTLPQARLHPAVNALDLAIQSRGADMDLDGDPFQLNVTNALWGQAEFPIETGFLDVLGLSYGAGLRVVDFVNATEASRLVINKWVEEQTAGRIEDLLPSGVITAMTRLVLTNAIYFKASWDTPFEESSTRDGAFHLTDGGEVTVPLMRQESTYGLFADPMFQAIELPYVGELFSMVVILPNEGSFATVERSLDADRLAGIFEGFASQRVNLVFPKFKVEFNLPLKQKLAELGMPIAFGGGADLSGIADVQPPLFIQDVLHKAFVEVNEKGTEAAAATAVIVGIDSVPPTVRVDRPFVFMIRDVQSGTVLFLGRVLDPSS